MTPTTFVICNYCKKYIGLDVREHLTFHVDRTGNNCPNNGTILWAEVDLSQASPSTLPQSVAESSETSESPSV